MFIFLRKKDLKILISIIVIFTFITLILFDSGLLFASDNTEEIHNYYSLQNPVLTDNILDGFHTIYNKEDKIAYLTFDDGPSKRTTPKVLDILAEEEIKASFFVIGKNVEANPAIVKRAYEEGHYIANHGYSHNNKKLYKSKESFLQEILKTDQAIAKAINVDHYISHIFRFPNGSMGKYYHTQKMQSISYLSEIDYTYVDWNALNNDSIKKYSDSTLLANLKKSCSKKGNLVILMHDSGDVNKTYTVLQDSIRYLKQEGYEFKTWYDLLETKKEEN